MALGTDTTYVSVDLEDNLGASSKLLGSLHQRVLIREVAGKKMLWGLELDHRSAISTHAVNTKSFDVLKILGQSHEPYILS